MGESVLRWSLSTREDSSNELILASMACCNERSREFTWLGFMEWCHMSHVTDQLAGTGVTAGPYFKTSNLDNHRTLLIPIFKATSRERR